MLYGELLSGIKSGLNDEKQRILGLGSTGFFKQRRASPNISKIVV